MTPKLYMANTFLPAYARLPTAQQKKVSEFMEKFQDNPTLASINYEPIHGVRDPRAYGSYRQNVSRRAAAS